MDVSGVQWTLYEVAKGVGWIVFAWSEVKRGSRPPLLPDRLQR